MQNRPSFSAIVLAGSRPDGDPVAKDEGAPCKAVVEVAGVPMVLRVLDALSRAASVGSVHVAGLPEGVLQDPVIRAGLDRYRATLLKAGHSPSATVAQALPRLPDHRPVLVTTADHALLEPRFVDAFASGARDCGADVAIGLARAAAVFAVVPDTKRTVTRLSDGGYCGTNLFALLTPRARAAVDFAVPRSPRINTPPILVSMAFNINARRIRF